MTDTVAETCASMPGPFWRRRGAVSYHLRRREGDGASTTFLLPCRSARDVLADRISSSLICSSACPRWRQSCRPRLHSHRITFSPYTNAGLSRCSLCWQKNQTARESVLCSKRPPAQSNPVTCSSTGSRCIRSQSPRTAKPVLPESRLFPKQHLQPNPFQPTRLASCWHLRGSGGPFRRRPILMTCKKEACCDCDCYCYRRSVQNSISGPRIRASSDVVGGDFGRMHGLWSTVIWVPLGSLLAHHHPSTIDENIFSSHAQSLQSVITDPTSRAAI